METAIFIYLASIAPAVDEFFSFMSVLSGLVTIILVIATVASSQPQSTIERHKEKLAKSDQLNEYVVKQSEDVIFADSISNKLKKIAKIVGSVFVVASLITVLVPKEERIWLIAGGYMTQSVVQSQIGQDMVEIVAAKVRKYKNEILKEAAPVQEGAK